MKTQRQRITLREGCFGNHHGHSGMARIIAREDGSEPPMGWNISEEGYVGGYTYLHYQEEDIKDGQGCCEQMWEVFLVRDGAFHYFDLYQYRRTEDGIFERQKLGEAVFRQIDEEKIEWIDRNSDSDVIELLRTTLAGAASAAIERSNEKAPKGIYWGILNRGMRARCDKAKVKNNRLAEAFDIEEPESSPKWSEEGSEDQEVLCDTPKSEEVPADQGEAQESSCDSAE